MLESAHANSKPKEQVRNKKPAESSSEEPSTKKAKKAGTGNSETVGKNNKNNEKSKGETKSNKSERRKPTSEGQESTQGKAIDAARLPTEGVEIPGAAVGVGIRIAERFGQVHMTQLMGDLDAVAWAKQEAQRRTAEKKKKKCAPC